MTVVEMKAQEGPCVGSRNTVLLSRRSRVGLMDMPEG